MKSPFNITTIINESSIKLSSVANHVSKSKSLNPTLTNKNELVISGIQKHIKEFNNEINIQSKNEINTSIESTSVISLNKDDNLVKNNPQIVNYDQPNCLNNDRQLVDHKNNNNNNISSANLLLKSYDPKMYYNFDACLGDNNNIKTYARRSIL